MIAVAVWLLTWLTYSSYRETVRVAYNKGWRDATEAHDAEFVRVYNRLANDIDERLTDAGYTDPKVMLKSEKKP